MVLSPKNSINKRQLLGLPWQSSGSGSKLAMQETQVQSLVGELRSCMPHGVTPIASHPLPKKTKTKKTPNQGTAINVVTNYLGHRGKGSHGEAGDRVFSLPPSHGRVYTCTDLCVGVCTRVIPHRDEPGRKPGELPHPSRNRPRLPAVPRLGKGPTELFWVS